MELERMRVMVTGATGFVGHALARHLAATGAEVVAPVRRPVEMPGLATPHVGEIGPGTDWAPLLDGVDGIVHCAGRAHQIADSATNPLAAFRSVNTAGTLALAEAAASAGVRRLVFVSSAKVHGEGGSADQPFSEDAPPAPADPYAVSKWEAEEGLTRLAARSELEVVTVRPPLVYGPEPKANMLRLLRLIDSGMPLPLGAIRNRRSMVGLENLASALATALAHPAAAGRTYVVSDQRDISTPHLIRLLAAAMGRPARLFPVPPMLLQLLGRLSSRQADMDRLIGSFVLDSSRISDELGWRPVRSFEEGIAAMAGSYLRR
jgi:nucleoside-diphosphate-sugar epimerase